jgi:hypothetical protein
MTSQSLICDAVAEPLPGPKWCTRLHRSWSAYCRGFSECSSDRTGGACGSASLGVGLRSPRAGSVACAGRFHRETPSGRGAPRRSHGSPPRSACAAGGSRPETPPHDAGLLGPRLQQRPTRHVGQRLVGLCGDPFDRNALASWRAPSRPPSPKRCSPLTRPRADSADPRRRRSRTKTSGRRRSDRTPTSENPGAPIGVVIVVPSVVRHCLPEPFLSRSVG